MIIPIDYGENMEIFQNFLCARQIITPLVFERQSQRECDRQKRHSTPLLAAVSRWLNRRYPDLASTELVEHIRLSPPGHHQKQKAFRSDPLPDQQAGWLPAGPLSDHLNRYQRNIIALHPWAPKITQCFKQAVAYLLSWQPSQTCNDLLQPFFSKLPCL
jgi:hypothetical protein